MLIALLTGFQPNPQKDTEEEKVKAAIGNFFQSIEKYDYDGIRNACTGDFVIFENGVRMSCEDFIGFLKNYENMGAEMTNYQLDNFTAEVKGRNAWVTLDNKGTGRMGEQRLEFNWPESAVLKKEKGEWKIAFYHSTEKPKPKPDLEKEKEAIMSVIQEEGDAAAEMDMERLFAVHVQDSLDTRLSLGKNNYTIYAGWHEIKHLFDGWTEMDRTAFENPKNLKENVILKVIDDCAWLICDNIWKWNYEDLPDERVNIQITFLEKIENEWKISFTAFIAKPEPEKLVEEVNKNLK